MEDGNTMALASSVHRRGCRAAKDQAANHGAARRLGPLRKDQTTPGLLWRTIAFAKRKLQSSRLS